MSIYNVPPYGSTGGQGGSIDWMNYLAPIGTLAFGIGTGNIQHIGQGLGGITDAAQVGEQNRLNAENMARIGDHLGGLSNDMYNLTGLPFNIQYGGQIYSGGNAAATSPGTSVPSAVGRNVIGYSQGDPLDMGQLWTIPARQEGQTDAQYQAVIDAYRTNRETALQNAMRGPDGKLYARGLPIYGDPNDPNSYEAPVIDFDINPQRAGSEAWADFSSRNNLEGRAQSIANWSSDEMLDRILTGPFGTEGVMDQVKNLLTGQGDKFKLGIKGIMGDVGNIIRGGKVDADELASRIMGLFPTEGIDASADIAQLGLLKQKLDDQARASGAASGARGPMSAQEFAAAQYGYAPGIAAAGLQAQQAADKFNIGLKQTAAQAGAGGMLTGEQINAGLTGQHAGIVGQLGSAGLEMQFGADQALARILGDMSGQRGQFIQGAEMFEQAQMQQGLEDLIRLGGIDAMSVERAKQGDIDAQNRVMSALLQQNESKKAAINFDANLAQYMGSLYQNPGAMQAQSLLASDYLKQTFPGMMGQKPEQPEEPSPWESLIGPAASGAGTAGTLMLTKSMTGMCLSAHTELMTQRGWKTLADVKVGDHVIVPSGEWDEVVYKDFGLPPHTMFRTIECGEWEITLSDDHIIEGKAADRWAEGDIMPHGQLITRITPVRLHVPCGDLGLKKNSEYLVRHFTVSSMWKQDREDD